MRVLISPTQIHKELLKLPNAKLPTANPTSSRAANPTPLYSASLASLLGAEEGVREDADGCIEKSEKALNACPTTYVMNGAIPPATREESTAGRRRRRR
ncbi:hypothetical protein CVT26_009726 [Gymnopilus dilepis]|uniref:Uncharacterized protein n=1 Tax=Gymnopilus dilepis TaxID=231916 RepID=A0A409XCQ5_9AGAR|nr:hypothetical protein CVT26_009726 [Gymnopilus dilepis]